MARCDISWFAPTRRSDCSSHRRESTELFTSQAQSAAAFIQEIRPEDLPPTTTVGYSLSRHTSQPSSEDHISTRQSPRMFRECSGKLRKCTPPQRDPLSAGDVPRTAHGPHTTGTVPAGAEPASSAACTRPCVRPCVVSNYADRCFCTLRPLEPRHTELPSRCSISLSSLHFPMSALFDNTQSFVRCTVYRE